MYPSDQGMKLIGEGTEEAASGRAEHMETAIFAIGIEQLQIQYWIMLFVLLQ